MPMGTIWKRNQRVARYNYGCDVCGRTIWENCEYMVLTAQKRMDGPRTRYRRHIHCDALLHLYAEEHGSFAAIDSLEAVEEWMEQTCRAECGASDMCGHDSDRFSCGQLLWLLLRHKNSYGAVVKSAEQSRRESDRT